MDAVSTKITELRQVIDVAAHAFLKWHTHVWFRGQGDAENWTLVPTVFRKPEYSPAVEASMTKEFQRLAPARSSDCPPINDKAAWPEWLSLMRQRGLPTRLLDWTRSILTATFFATDPAECPEETDACIWALNPLALNAVEMEAYTLLPFSYDYGGLERAEAVINALLEPAFSPSKRISAALAVSPSHVDSHVVAQQCHYTIHGDNTPLETLTLECDCLLKFLIAGDAKLRIFTELQMVGIDRSTLFPDLFNLAAMLKRAYVGADPLADTEINGEGTDDR